MTRSAADGRRARKRRLGACALAFAVAACSRKPVASFPDPVSAHRFAIVSASDTLFRFMTTNARWVRPGSVGIAVDPRRRDSLVARYVVRGVTGDTATAFVTGQTTDLSPADVALLAPPRRGWLRQRAFWIGVASGSAAATAVVAAAR